MSEENREINEILEPKEMLFEDNVSAISTDDGDAFAVSHEIDSSNIDNDNSDDVDIDPIIILETKPKRFNKIIQKLNGAKIFALILALALILVACFSAGYYMGVNTEKPLNIALDERPKGEVLNTSEVYNSVNPSVVGIIIYNTEGESSMASGVIYSDTGYIVTNDHIYSGIQNAKFKIYTSSGKEFDATYIAGDTRSDLAVLKTNAVGLAPAKFGNSDSCIIGEGAVAIGRPAGATNDSNISKGVICGVNVRVQSSSTSYSERFIQTDTAINPGSSGGALCNMYGQVIGITSSKLVGDAYEGVGYAIPTTRMKIIVDSLIKNKNVLTRAKVGISYTEIDSVLSEINKLPKGLYVASVDESSKFFDKLKTGDIITEINNTPASTETVLGIIEKSMPGDEVKFTVFRKSTNKTFDVTAPLLADKGSSSYTTEGSTNDTSSKYNTNEFDFPEID